MHNRKVSTSSSGRRPKIASLSMTETTFKGKGQDNVTVLLTLVYRIWKKCILELYNKKGSRSVHTQSRTGLWPWPLTIKMHSPGSGSQCYSVSVHNDHGLLISEIANIYDLSYHHCQLAYHDRWKYTQQLVLIVLTRLLGAKDNWWGLSTRNAHMVNALNSSWF